MKGTMDQTSPTASPTTSPLASKSPSSGVARCLATPEKQTLVDGKLFGANKKKGHPSNRILKSGSALFITSKKNAAFAQGQKTSKNLFPIPNSPAQSSSNVKLIVFPKMNKVIIFDKLKEDEVVARVKLDMNSALRDRTEGQNCYSVQSYEPNDQSEGGRSLRGGDKPNLFGDDLLTATAATSVYRRRQANFASSRTKNICIIVSIALLLLIGLITMIVTVVIILTSKAESTGSVDFSTPSSANLTDTNSTGNFSAFENRIRRKMVIAGIKSFFRRLRHKMEDTIDQRIYP